MRAISDAVADVRLADLDEATAFATEIEASFEELAARAVEHDVHALSVRETQDLVGEVSRPGVHHVRNTQRPDGVPFLRTRGREHLGARGSCQLYRGLPDGPGRRVNEHALAAPQTSKILERVVGRQESDRNRRRRLEAELDGALRDELDAGTHVGAERSLDEPRDDGVSFGEIRHPFADGGHDAATLEAETDVGRTRDTSFAFEALEHSERAHDVPEVQPGGSNLDLDLPRTRRGPLDRNETQVLEEAIVAEDQPRRLTAIPVGSRPSRRRPRNESCDTPFAARNATSGSWCSLRASRSSAWETSPREVGSRSIKEHRSSGCSSAATRVKPQRLAAEGATGFGAGLRSLRTSSHDRQSWSRAHPRPCEPLQEVQQSTADAGLLRRELVHRDAIRRPRVETPKVEDVRRRGLHRSEALEGLREVRR